MAKKESAEEIQKREMIEQSRAIALKNLRGPTLWSYALPQLATKERYGELAGYFDERYRESIKHAPNEEVYQQVFAPVLQSEDGVLNKLVIQKRSATVIFESVSRLYAEDLFAEIGSSKKLKKGYEGKLIGELSEKDRQTIIPLYMEGLIRKHVYEALSKMPNEAAGGLEQILAEPEKKAA